MALRLVPSTQPITLSSQSPRSTPPLRPSPLPNPRPQNHPNIVKMVEVTNIKETTQIETGYGDTNAWLEWIKYSVGTLHKSDCFACATGRPEAQVVPFPLGWSSDPRGPECIMALFQDRTAWNNESCRTLSLLFPKVKSSVDQPLRTVWPPSKNISFSSCLEWQGAETTFLGNLTRCSESQCYNTLHNKSQFRVPWADVWCYCGSPLMSSLPENWSGTCALMQLAIPFTLHLGPNLKLSQSKRKETPLQGVLWPPGLYWLNRCSTGCPKWI